MSKSSELDKAVKQYILDHVDGSGYEVYPQTDIEKVQFLHDAFYAEYGWAVSRMGEQRALKEWYSGLPSACTVDFYDYEILKLAYRWGYLPEKSTDRQKQKIVDNWFNLVAGKTAQLFHKYTMDKVA